MDSKDVSQILRMNDHMVRLTRVETKCAITKQIMAIDESINRVVWVWLVEHIKRQWKAGNPMLQINTIGFAS